MTEPPDLVYALIYFDVHDETDGLRYPLPVALQTAVLDSALHECAREHIPIPELTEYSDEGLLHCWSTALEALLEQLSPYDKRCLLFPTERHLILFHNIKRRLRLHAKSSNNGTLVKIDSPPDQAWSLEKMLAIVQSIGAESLATHPDVFSHKEKKVTGIRENMLAHSSFCYMGDNSTKLYHRLDSACLEASDPVPWRGLGKDPQRSGFRPCPVCVGATSHHSAPQSKARSIPPQQHKSKSRIMREQLIAVGEQYGLHCEIVGGMVYITTIAGEWYFN